MQRFYSVIGLARPSRYLFKENKKAEHHLNISYVTQLTTCSIFFLVYTNITNYYHVHCRNGSVIVTKSVAEIQFLKRLETRFVKTL